MTRFVVIPLLVVVVLFGLIGPSPILALGLGIVAVIPALTTARFEASRAAQVVIAIALFGGAITVFITLLATTYVAPELLRTPWAAFTGSVLLVAVTRNYFREPMGGDAGTIGVGLCALTGCGGAKTDLLYPVFVFLFLASAALARRRADDGRAPRKSLTAWPQLVRSGSMLAIGAAIATAFIVTMPPLHDWAKERILERISAQSGFTQRMWLGSMQGMLLSDKKVLRVHGDDVDYLRGIVYSRYLGGRWSIANDELPAPKHPPESLSDDPSLVEIRYVDSEPKRYFLPLEVGEVSVSSGIALVDRLGVIAPVAAEPANRISYRRTGERAFPVAPPDDRDLDVPEVTFPLRRVAEEWTRDATTPEEIADAISERLQHDFSYSLDFSHSGRHDPVVEFVLRGREGHCEYFASAMALMVRMRGVPTRLVGGYRVTEYNDIGGYYIVRERNAHAWVEVYLPERGWTTYDPTPAAEIAQHAPTSTLAGLVDALGSGWSSFLSWLDRRTWGEVLSVPAIAIVIPLLIRIILRRRKRQREETDDGAAPALPCFVELTDALARRGVVRGASETIEQLAARLSNEDAALSEHGSVLLRRYAAFRYGGIGDQSSLEGDIRSFCHDLDEGSR